jgi:acyl dehydratase
VPFDGDRVMALRRVTDCTFKRPVNLGDTIRVKGKVAEVSEISDEAGLVAFTWSVLNQDERVVCRARVEVLWRREAATDSEGAEASSEFVAIPL